MFGTDHGFVAKISVMVVEGTRTTAAGRVGDRVGVGVPAFSIAGRQTRLNTVIASPDRQLNPPYGHTISL
jgi:hypothetical protein